MYFSEDRRLFLSQYLNHHQQWLSLVETSEFTVRIVSLTSVGTSRRSWTVEISRLNFWIPFCWFVRKRIYRFVLNTAARFPSLWHNEQTWFKEDPGCGQLTISPRAAISFFGVSSIILKSFVSSMTFFSLPSVCYCALSKTSSAAWAVLRDCGWKDNHSKPVTAHWGHNRQQMCCHRGEREHLVSNHNHSTQLAKLHKLKKNNTKILHWV